MGFWVENYIFILDIINMLIMFRICRFKSPIPLVLLDIVFGNLGVIFRMNQSI